MIQIIEKLFIGFYYGRSANIDFGIFVVSVFKKLVLVNM